VIAIDREPEVQVSPYATNWEHLADELRWLDLLLHLRLLERHGEAADDPLGTFKGLVISEQEVLRLLVPATAPAGAAAEAGQRARLVEALTRLGSRIAERRARTAENPQEAVDLTLPRLSRIFHLSPFEERCLLLCLAPEVDRRYEKLYAYLQDDVTRHRPTVGLVFDLLCGSREEALAARAVFEPQAPLVKARLVQLHEGAAGTPLLSRALKLEDRVAELLLGSASIAAARQEVSALILPGSLPEEPAADGDLLGRMAGLIRARLGQAEPSRLVFYLHGPYGTGKRALPHAVCAELGLPLVVGDVARMLESPRPFEESVWLLAREAALQPAALHLSGFDRLAEEEGAREGRDARHGRERWSAALEAIRLFSRVTFLSGERPWNPAGTAGAAETTEAGDLVDVELAVPSPPAARALWERHAAADPRLASYVDAGGLASKFRLTPGQIRDAVALAGSLAAWRSPEGAEITSQDLHAACRLQTNQRITRVARKVEPSYRWAELVLPEDALCQLREVCDQAKLRHVVFGAWGFDRRLSLGKGLNVLFSGPPGTGKTMAAEVLANDLGLDLYRIDLSQVISKYIGETEKNLDHVFAAAEGSNAILFFDEADALFGKRSEVRDSHDRYANVEVSYLLQKMEEYQGIAILATNLRQHMDQAFLRRLSFTIHFPFPDEESRRRIWAGAWPPEAPLGEDVDFAALARQFKLAGGNIKNIALCAAFLAAAEDSPVRQGHLLRATRREFQKIGKTISDAEMGSAS
jgi:ATP-dependent 26S proteasome regulatory subunit